MIELIAKGTRKFNIQKNAYNLLSVLPSPYYLFSSKSKVGSLRQFYNDPDNSSICNNFIEECPKYDLHIIIPVYNVEMYVRDCIDSILKQKTEYSYFISIINDGSTDNSREVLNVYAHHDNIEIIDQCNAGQASARNKALNHIRGKYIMFVDSDDRLPENSINPLLQTAERTDADIVEGGYRFFNDAGKILGVIRNVDSDDNRHLFGFPWRKVYKSHLWQQVHFPEGYWFEDTCGWMMILPQVKRMATISDIVYEYRKNNNSTTRRAMHNPKCLCSLYVTRRLLEDRKLMGFPFDEEFYTMMLHQLGTNCRRICDLGNRNINLLVFEEQIRLMKKYFPNLE